MRTKTSAAQSTDEKGGILGRVGSWVTRSFLSLAVICTAIVVEVNPNHGPSCATIPALSDILRAQFSYPATISVLLDAVLFLIAQFRRTGVYIGVVTCHSIDTTYREPQSVRRRVSHNGSRFLWPRCP